MVSLSAQKPTQLVPPAGPSWVEKNVTVSKTKEGSSCEDSK